MMIISNVTEKSDGVMVTSKSCHHENYPEKEGVTRMQIFLAGYYFERIHDDEYKTKVFSLTKAHFGGSISQKFIKKATTMTLPKLYQTMEKCMQDYYKLNS